MDSSEHYQGFWALLGPHEIIPKKEKNISFSDFALYALVHFQNLNLAKVFFLLQPPKIYCSCFVESNKFP